MDNLNDNNDNNKKIKICLNMIVKNESKVILRCINSVSHLLDAVAIADTGSDDNTVNIIEDFIKEKKFVGGVGKYRWKNFGHNRTESLKYAESIIRDIPGIWYILFMDADDLVIGNDGSLNNLTLISLDKSKLDLNKCIYYINMKCGTLSYERAWMVKYDPNRPWKWFHVLHEYIALENGSFTPNEVGKISTGYIQATRDGARSQDIVKYLRDAVTLEASLKEKALENSDAVPDAREIFYLAQSYRDSHIPHLLKNAEKIYLQRITLGGWPEEVYISYIESGKCRQMRNKNDFKTMELFMKAYELRPHRFEAIYHIVRWFRLHDMFKMGYTFGRPLINLPYPKDDRLFVNDEIHTWRLYDEISVCAFYAGDKKMCKLLSERILKVDSVDSINRERILKNIQLSS